MKKIPSVFSREIKNAIKRLKIHSYTTFKFRGEEFGISECLDFSDKSSRSSYWVLSTGGKNLYPRTKSSRLYKLREDAIRLAIIELTMNE